MATRLHAYPSRLHLSHQVRAMVQFLAAVFAQSARVQRTALHASGCCTQAAQTVLLAVNQETKYFFDGRGCRSFLSCGLVMS
jgi:hypothetical protein